MENLLHYFLIFPFVFLFTELIPEIKMRLPAVENSKEVFETTPSTPEATIVEEYMQDLNKILSADVRKLYNEKLVRILDEFFHSMWTHG